MQQPPPLSDPPPAASVAPPADPPLPVRIRGARYLVAGLLLSLIAAVVLSTYLRIESQLRQTLETQLTAVLDENVHSFSGWLERQAELGAHIADLPGVQQVASSGRGRDGISPSARHELERALTPLYNAQVIEGAALYSPEGKLLVSLSSRSAKDEIQIDPATRADLKQWGSATTLFNVGPQLHLRTLAVVGPLDAPTALLAVRPRLTEESLLPRVLAGGNTYAFNRTHVLSERLDGAGADPLPGSAGNQFLDRAPVQTTIEDYVGREGIPVVGAWTWLPDYHVGVATEVPQDEALSAIARLRRSFLVLVTLVGAAVLGFIALGRWTLRVREESVLMTQRLGRLARAIQPLSAALEHDPSAVVLVDHEGAVVYANAASHRVLGVTEPLLGEDVDNVFDNLHAELQAALMSGRDSIVAKGTGDEDETLLVSSRSLTIDGNPHFLYMLRPVTQQVRRQEVEHWKKLIRVLSHELNNALAPITSLLSSARKVNQMTHQDARLGQIFESISERTGHLVSFIEGYREVARLPRPDQREIEWRDFLAGLESQKKFTLEGNVPTRRGYFDPVQLERVLINVVNNSHEAGSAPEDVSLEVLEEPKGFRVNVLDRGSGMPEPVLKQAMLPFFSTKRTGTGVGLALSREIIEAHGGQLTLANRDGGGLVVSCFLPHPIQQVAHPSRSRLPVSLIPAEDAEPGEVSEPPT